MKKNLVLAFSIFVFLLIAAGSSFLYWFPRLLPTGFVMMLTDEGLHPLLQSSKKEVIPHRYIALLGDSYAAGMGDWATAEMSKPQARYSTAHLLQDATGKDVISFGSAGAGSVRGIVTEPVSQLAYLKQYISSDIEQPEWMLIYFYEGNDLYDNAAYFHYGFPRLFDLTKQFDSVTYQQYLQKFAIDRDDTMQIVKANDWLRHWPFLNFSNTFIRTLAGMQPRKIGGQGADVDSTLDPPWIMGGASFRTPGKMNQARISNQIVQLPDSLQGPALALNADELKQAWFAFDQSLQFTRKKFPDTHFMLVYIPSVLSTYELQSEQISVQTYERRERIFTRQQLLESSQQMRNTFIKMANDKQLPFVDTTDAMQSAAKIKALHGPEDWNHPNQEGYRVMTESIIQQLEPLLVNMTPRVNAP